MSVNPLISEDHSWAVTTGMKQRTQKSKLLYLSNRTEASQIYHKKKHTKMDTSATPHEFAHELTINFTKARNTTYDRFQIKNARQEPRETLKSFYIRLRELGAKAAFGAVEEDPVKDFVIGKMNNTAI